MEKITTNVLRVECVSAGYAGSAVLEDVSFELRPHESMAVLGRNGAGKSTLFCTIMGLTDRLSGTVVCNDIEVSREKAYRRASRGIGWVPQERGIFSTLTVEENLTVAARRGPWTVTRVYDLFPRLRERRKNMGHQLSGGERQMLAVARALLLNPNLILLDEPLEGLAPIVASELLDAIGALSSRNEVSILLAEQHARQVLRMTERALVLQRGRVVYIGESATLLKNESALLRWLGAAAELRGSVANSVQ